MTSVPFRGMKADEVLKMKGRGEQDALDGPTPVFSDGQVVEVWWHYPDCDVMFRKRHDVWRVAEVQRHDASTVA